MSDRPTIADLPDDVDTVWKLTGISQKSSGPPAAHTKRDCERLRGKSPNKKDVGVLFDDQPVCQICLGMRKVVRVCNPHELSDKLEDMDPDETLNQPEVSD